MEIKKRNKIYLSLLSITIFIIALIFILSGCQSMTRDMGGTTTITLEPNEKLEEITWKENSLWYLTRPMREDEEPETHRFKQSTEFGILEGEVIIIERR